MLFIVALSFILTITGTASAVTDVNTTSAQYQIGQQVTQQALADTTLNMRQADKNLVITTAGTAYLNGTTTEESAQAVVDKTSALEDGQRITYGSGNLLIINDPDGPLWFTFISQTGTTLMAKTFTINQSGTITASKTVNIATTQTNANFKDAITKLGSKGYNLAAIANLWAAGAPADLLITTYTTRAITPETISSYAEAKSFALKFTTPGIGNLNNYVITNAGGMDDDIGYYGTFGYSFSSTSSGTPGETVFINYNTDSKTNARTGTLVLMKGNNLTNQFTSETGTSVVKGSLSEIKYDLWLLNKLKTDPASLFSVLAFKNVNENDIAYLWYDSSVGYSHGIDEAYISGLTNVAGGWTPINNILPTIDYNNMFSIGQQAFNAAYSAGLFNVVDLAAGRVAVVLPPYDADYLGTYSLVGLSDGVENAARTLLATSGYTNVAGFTIDNILFLRRGPMWRGSSIQLFFVNVDPSSITTYSQNRNIDSLIINAVKVASTYSNTTNAFSLTASAIKNISPSLIAAANKNPNDPVAKAADPSSWFGNSDFGGTIYAWAGGVPYNYLSSLLMVGCISPETKEYDIATNLKNQYPLGPNEHYIVFNYPSSGVCTRTMLYGVSPSAGTYYATWTPTTAAYYSCILIIWNDLTNSGKAMLIQYDPTIITNEEKSDGYTAYGSYNDPFWHLDKVWNNGSDAGVVASAISTVKTLNNMNQNFLDNLTTASNPVSYMLNYVSPTASADIGSGLYNANQTITLTAAPGTTIYYTLNGTTPTISSSVYNTPIAITQTSTLQYIAVDPSGYISPVYTQNYTIEKPTNPTNPNNPTNPTNPGENYLETPATVSAATETITAPNTETTQALAATNPTSTNIPTNNKTNTPLGAAIVTIIVVIMLAIVAVLIYLARDTIIATIKGTEKPGK